MSGNTNQGRTPGLPQVRLEPDTTSPQVRGSRTLWLTAAVIGLSMVLATAQAPQPARLHVLDIQSADDLKAFYRAGPDQPVLLTTHRGGARDGFPENAIETFDNTLRHVWSALEVDPRYTKDRQIVLFHDPTLERTSNGTGRVIDHTYDQLHALRLKDPAGRVTPFAIPTLDQALAWAKGKTVLFLDFKDVDVIDRARAIQRHDARAWAVVMAYTFEDARRLYDFDPAIMMQVFLPDSAAVARFEATGVPWTNVVGFVTHTVPKEPDIFERLAARGVRGILGTSRTIDRAYLAGEITRPQLASRYGEALRQTGASIVEADLGIEAGAALEQGRPQTVLTSRYFRLADAPPAGSGR
jgi:glycerophosphoryl diester phosphodiesterase